jgi:hypothetical protein
MRQTRALAGLALINTVSATERECHQPLVGTAVSGNSRKWEQPLVGTAVSGNSRKWEQP